MELKNVLSAVKETIDRHAAELIEVGDHIWKNPEPGYREEKTSAYLAGKLEELGLKVKRGLALTGFRADIDTGRPGPVLAVLGELDSLILPNHPQCDKKTGAVHAADTIPAPPACMERQWLCSNRALWIPCAERSP